MSDDGLKVDAIFCPDCGHPFNEHSTAGCLHPVSDLEHDFCQCYLTPTDLNDGIIAYLGHEFYCPCGCDGDAEHCVYAGTCIVCGRKYYGGKGYGDKASACDECRATGQCHQ